MPIADQPLDQLTVREMFTDLERLLHEMIEHLDRGFIPKVQHLRDLVRHSQTNLDELQDLTLRTHTADLLKNEDFTNELSRKIEQYLIAIDTAVTQIVEGSSF